MWTVPSFRSGTEYDHDLATRTADGDAIDTLLDESDAEAECDLIAAEQEKAAGEQEMDDLENDLAIATADSDLMAHLLDESDAAVVFEDLMAEEEHAADTHLVDEAEHDLATGTADGIGANVIISPSVVVNNGNCAISTAGQRSVSRSSKAVEANPWIVYDPTEQLLTW